MVSPRLVLAITPLFLVSAVTAHGGDGAHSTDVATSWSEMAHTTFSATARPTNVDLFDQPSYSGLSQHSGMLLAHVVLMVLAWMFVLPLGQSSTPRCLQLA